MAEYVIYIPMDGIPANGMMKWSGPNLIGPFENDVDAEAFVDRVRSTERQGGWGGTFIITPAIPPSDIEDSKSQYGDYNMLEYEFPTRLVKPPRDPAYYI